MIMMRMALSAQVACLGVPDAQWAALGHAALQALQLEVASKAFGRIKETSYLRLLHQLEQARKAGQPAAILKADVLAYQVRFVFPLLRCVPVATAGVSALAVHTSPS